MENQNIEREQDAQDQQEHGLENLIDDAAEGLWLRLRDLVLVHRQLERFVF